MDRFTEKNIKRLKELCDFENEIKRLHSIPHTPCYVAGVDEAGRGPLAGPVVAAAVVFDKIPEIIGINDSKKLSTKQREKLFFEIEKKCITFSIGIVDAEQIDKYNILQATYIAMRTAIKGLTILPDIVLVDGNEIPSLDIKQISICQGDAKCASIACASIIAKVTRDRIMNDYNEIYPQYNFIKNKGYGTKEHLLALEKFGPCKIHRKTFFPIRRYFQDKQR